MSGEDWEELYRLKLLQYIDRLSSLFLSQLEEGSRNRLLDPSAFAREYCYADAPIVAASIGGLWEGNREDAGDDEGASDIGL